MTPPLIASGAAGKKSAPGVPGGGPGSNRPPEVGTAVVAAALIAGTWGPFVALLLHS